MGKTLVIVESPAKAKTINKYLGSDYIVKSSIGHIRDLPTGGNASKAVDPKERAKAAAFTRKLSPEDKIIHKKKKARAQLVKRMGIDPENGWEPSYEVLPGKEKVVAELKRLAQDADEIYLATDLDREGEAIAWHLREAIGGDDSRYRRVVFNEITKKAIQEAFQKPTDVDMNHVNAQQTRRFLDRVVGFMVSPLLWAKVARGLSAGRVQSVAVRLIVEREREIRAFIPEEYWEVKADCLTPGQESLALEVKKHAGQAFRPNCEADTLKAVSELESHDFKVASREDRAGKTKPNAPFITSTLQQAASTRLGFSVKKTMMMAQRLYEAGYITYMRTDSTNLSVDAVESCREFILDTLSPKYLPEEPIRYSSKEGAQEAHEAIRPSEVLRRAENLSDMEKDAVRLYDLIWRQFVACQMVPMEYLTTTITVEAGDYELKTKGRIVKFDGFTRIMAPVSKKDEDGTLPDVTQGEVLKVNQLRPTQHFTKPTPRFSEAALVKELEKKGIGRPSTYASIISTIQDRGYVALKNKRFYAEKMGDIVTDRLTENFSDLMDFSFTAKMEESLDSVALGKQDWIQLLDQFYEDFSAKLEKADDSENGMRANDPTATDIACPSCGRDMQIRTGTTGVFLGCSGYALPPKERCKTTINLIPEEETVSLEDEEGESRVLRSKHRCTLCNTAMDGYLIDENRKLHVCGNNPDCVGFEVEKGSYKIKGYDGPLIDCDKCGAQMELKTGRFGKYFGCTSESCKNTRKLLKSGQPAPPKMDPVPMPELRCDKVDDHYILRDGAAGLFLAASGFPKNRETRAPLLAEIAPHKDEIDPKYAFLFDGPLKDHEGLPSVVRFSRKEQQIYLMSEKEGKASGWRAHFVDGKWVEEIPKPKAKPKAKAKAKAKPKAKLKTKAKAKSKAKASPVAKASAEPGS